MQALEISASEFTQSEDLAGDRCLRGAELRKVFWLLRGQQKELARKERFWAATNENLASAYRTLEQRTTELKQAREELVLLNQHLEQRVAEQVEEIIRRAREVEALNIQLQHKVRERSRELAAALRRLAQGRGGSSALGPGTLVGGRARITRVLGQGGMGTVYQAEDLLTGCPVAVKVMHPSAATDSSAVQRFVSEAAAAAAITHPGVIKTLHIDVTAEGRIYLLMEYVEGTDLRARSEQSRLTIAECVRIGAALAEALAEAHAVGVVHRDLKPSNVILCPGSPGVRILDFGISKLPAGEGQDSLTRTCQIMGTPQYMSPEKRTLQLSDRDFGFCGSWGLIWN